MSNSSGNGSAVVGLDPFAFLILMRSDQNYKDLITLSLLTLSSHLC